MTPGVDLSVDVLERVSELVRRRAGLAFDDARRPVVEAGVRTAMRRAGIRYPDRYIELLQYDPGVFDELLAEITVGETYFFRDSEQFALLRNRLLPDLFRSRRAQTDMPRSSRVRIWSAACSSGEEPYSIAIALHQLGLLSEAYLLGTDISRPALQRARQARYSRWSLRGVPDEIVATYFKRTGDRFTLTPMIRDAVEFRYLNLADDRYPSVPSGVWDMDLVLCRNALIYFAIDQVPKVAERLLNSMSDKGWLLLGSADPLLSELNRCHVQVTPAGLVYRRVQGTSFDSSKQRASGADWSTERVSTSASSSGSNPKLTTSVTTAIDAAAHADREAGTEAETEADEPLSARAAQLYATREYRSAADTAAAAIADRADSVEIRVILINSLVNCGELDRAESVCRDARDHYDASAELAALHAFVLLEAGDTRDAELAARQAVYLDPALPVVHLALGAALVRLRDGPAARRAFRNAERLLAAMPADAPVLGAGDEPAGRLAELARAQLTLLHGSAS